MVMTVGRVCLTHGRHWPCKELEPGERDHWWTYRTTWTAWGERKDKRLAALVEELGR